MFFQFDFSQCSCSSQQQEGGQGRPVLLGNVGPYPVIARFPSGDSTLLSPKERIGPSASEEIANAQVEWSGIKVFTDPEGEQSGGG